MINSNPGLGVVGAGLTSPPRYDNQGKQLCELCPTRLNRCKGKTYRFGLGKICQQCYNIDKGRCASQPKQEIKLIPLPPQPPQPLPVQTASPLYEQYTYPVYGWNFKDPARTSTGLAKSWAKMSRSDKLDDWEHIRSSGSYQHIIDLDSVDGTEQYFRSVLEQSNIDHSVLKVSETKLLKAPPGSGQQLVHFDLDSYSAADQCYSCLLYCTQANSTAVPTHTLDKLKPTFSTTEKKPPDEALALLQRDQFYIKPVVPGETLVFKATVPHFGTQNDTRVNRIVVFALFSHITLQLPTQINVRFPFGVPSPRTKRPYSSLGSTERWKRRQRVRAVATDHDVPAEAIHKDIPQPSALVHLSKSVREQIRTVEGLTIPSEKSIRACKLLLAQTHGTETSTFVGGAYLTDPLTFVLTVIYQTKVLSVGGDAGGGHTKLGITYTINNAQAFAPLLVYDGTDSWELLSRLRTPGLTPFKGQSESHSHIYSILQYLIDRHSAFLNGDWPFMSVLLGLKSPSSSHPCPICIASSGSFLRTARYRLPSDKFSRHLDRIPLVTVPPERIVPTPLHLYLGIGNRIVFDGYKKLCGEPAVLQTIEQIKTVHSAGCGGLSDLYKLNGPELTKWIKQEQTLSMVPDSSICTVKASNNVLSSWLHGLHDYLLPLGAWSPRDIDEWRGKVNNIQSNWQLETQTKPFPQLHMLVHTVEFAERHRLLGSCSEAQIESNHYKFNALFHKQHLNMSSNTAERLRRSLADIVLTKVQSVAKSKS